MSGSLADLLDMKAQRLGYRDALLADIAICCCCSCSSCHFLTL